MDLFSVIAVAVVMGLIFALGEWLFGRLTSAIASRLHTGWRWLTLPITAVLSFGGFLALRPLVLDQPGSLIWFVLAFVAVALLVSTATALAWALLSLGRALLGVIRAAR